MTGRLTGTASLLALTLLLPGCGGGGAAEPGPSAGGSPPTPPTTATTDTAESTGSPGSTDSTGPPGVSEEILDVDLTALEWREQVGERYWTPVADPAAADPAAGPVVTVGEATHVDVDDDGDLDVMAPLVVRDGNSLSEIYYIWTWDADAGGPVQVENPIARTHDCGALVDRVSADPDRNAFVVAERLRRPGAEGACSDAPTLPVERAVTLSDGWPVLVTGIGGHGGICPQPEGHDTTWPVDGVELLAGPRESVGAVTDPQLNWFAEADVSGHRWLFREGWLLVSFGPLVGQGRDSHFAAYGEYTPCAWIAVDPARQSDLGVLPGAR